MKNTKDIINNFGNHIQDSVNNYYLHNIDIKNISNIVIYGIGVSYISGNIVSRYFYNKISIPINIISDCIVPRYVNKNSLLILLTSYMQNTEILSVYNILIKRKISKIIVISYNDNFFSKNDFINIIHYKIPFEYNNDISIGYSMTYLFQILFELINIYCKSEISKIAELMLNTNNYTIEATEICKNFNTYIGNSYIVISDFLFQYLGLRFCQQICSNTNINAINTTISNLVHIFKNKILFDNTNYLIINSRINDFNNQCFGIIRQILQKRRINIIDIVIKNRSLYDIYHTLYILDWIAYYIHINSKSFNEKKNDLNLLNDFLYKN